jgi:hypothetical protein
VTTEVTPKGQIEASQVQNWRESILGRESRRYTNPGMEMTLRCLNGVSLVALEPEREGLAGDWLKVWPEVAKGYMV